MVKLIVFASLFIAIHYGTASYFTPKISLFLGAAVMIVAIVASLLIEFSKQRRDGSF